MINLVAEGYLWGYIGYSNAFRNMCLELDKFGVNLKLINRAGLPRDFPLEKEEFERLTILTEEDRLKKVKDPFYLGMVIPSAFKKKSYKYNIGFTMFEAVNNPSIFKRYLDNLDEIWVPSKFNYDNFQRLLKEGNIMKVMPLGVDTDKFKPGVEKLGIGKNECLKFLTVGMWSSRKGYDILIPAFLETLGPESMLIIASGWNKGDEVRREVERYRREIKNKNLPEIIVYDKKIHPKDMPKLYAEADIFVLASRGEGDGQCVKEAMSSGLGVIVPRSSAMLDYCNDKNSFLIDIEGEKEINPWYGSLCPLYKGLRFSEPKKEHLKFLLKLVKDRQEEVKKRGMEARRTMVENYSWRIVCKKMMNRLEKIN